MFRGRVIAKIITRLSLSACLAVVLSGVFAPVVAEAAPERAPFGPRIPNRPRTSAQQEQPPVTPEQLAIGRRVVLSDVPSDIIPQNSNIWQCACDNDGCWPGCFTVASASILKYWSLKGFPNLWDGNENGALQRLRDLFPNLFCYNNVDDDGIPSDSGYEAFDVAKGFDLFVQERGYKFTLKPTPAPRFEQIVAEIDAGRPIIGAFGISPWGSHAATIIGYDTSAGQQVMIVRPNLWQTNDVELVWGVGYGEFGIVTVAPNLEENGGSNPSLDFEVIVNDVDAGFSVTGIWTLANVGFGNQSRYVQTTDPSNLGPTDETAVAKWMPSLPFDGLWEVYAWVPRQDTDDSAVPIATYRINHAEGQSLIRRSQNKARPGWMALGIFPFVRGEKGNVQLGNLTGDNPLRNVWADSVKFVWRYPLLVASEEGGPPAIVVNGARRGIPDEQTLQALQLNVGTVRKLSALEIAQYTTDEMLPSVMSQWVGTYYNNTLLSSPASSVQASPSLNFRWNGAAPAATVDAKTFSARWTRFLATTEGEYPFSINAVGGVRLWVDGKLEINDWDVQPGIYLKHEKTVKLSAGLHRIDVEYVNRDGFAQIEFGNLPPNVPIILDAAPANAWTTAPDVLLRWQDAGDADGIGGETSRKFFVTAWNQTNGWRINSGWIEATEWSLNLPQDGEYFWSVIASDGKANSDGTVPRRIQVDRTAPWAQMVNANTAVTLSAALQATATTQIDAYKLITDANGNMVVTQVADVQSAELGGTPIDQLAPRTEVSPSVVALGNLPAVHLTWWGKDAPREHGDGLRYDVQVRELMRATTVYTIAVENREVTRLAYELTISGTEEITTPIVITEVVPITTVAPIVTIAPITDSQWITFATGIALTETIFVGEPGSTYEFRVRAVDGAGNAQDWYEGYAVQAFIDPKTIFRRTNLPVVNR
jgi:hypothetical protein